MHACVDMHTCIYLHMHICIHARVPMHVYIQTRMHAFIHAYMHACVCAHENMHACIHVSCICTFMQTFSHAYVRYMCIHTNMHSCKHGCIRAWGPKSIISPPYGAFKGISARFELLRQEWCLQRYMQFHMTCCHPRNSPHDSENHSRTHCHTSCMCANQPVNGRICL